MQLSALRTPRSQTLALSLIVSSWSSWRVKTFPNVLEVHDLILTNCAFLACKSWLGWNTYTTELWHTEICIQITSWWQVATQKSLIFSTWTLWPYSRPPHAT